MFIINSTDMKTGHMNKWVLTFLSSATLIILILLSGCSGGDPTVSKQDEVKSKLTSPTWKMQSVIVDGTDQSGVYKDLSLKFSATGFTSTNGGAVWPASGTWAFTNENATAVKRDDGLEVQLLEVSETSLKLALLWSKTTLGHGRSKSVSGQHEFTFAK
jgi:hypothetical protein